MGVRINFSKTYKTLVTFDTVTETGKKEAQSFEAEFKRLKRDEVKDLIDSAVLDAEMLKQVLVGWKMVDMDTKESTPYTDENIDLFLSIPGAAGVTMLRFLETVGANRQKN